MFLKTFSNAWKVTPNIWDVRFQLAHRFYRSWKHEQPGLHWKILPHYPGRCKFVCEIYYEHWHKREHSAKNLTALSLRNCFQSSTNVQTIEVLMYALLQVVYFHYRRPDKLFYSRRRFAGPLWNDPRGIKTVSNSFACSLRREGEVSNRYCSIMHYQGICGDHRIRHYGEPKLKILCISVKSTSGLHKVIIGNRGTIKKRNTHSTNFSLGTFLSAWKTHLSVLSDFGTSLCSSHSCLSRSRGIHLSRLYYIRKCRHEARILSANAQITFHTRNLFDLRYVIVVGHRQRDTTPIRTFTAVFMYIEIRTTRWYRRR